jgi:ubiquitin-protein ligase
MDRNKIIRKKYKAINPEDVEGLVFNMDKYNEDYPEGEFILGIMKLEFTMNGPKDTLWDGKTYNGDFTFDERFPVSPPVVKFHDNMYHPNIYNHGEVCISILHEGHDITQSEKDPERWTPIYTLTTIIMCILLIFHEPNLSSPANIDASVAYQYNKEGLQKVINGEADLDDVVREARSIRRSLGN